jgi:uncharacterized protein (TIGR02172 family)
MYNLENLKKIAEGGQAEIYLIDDKKVLRLLRRPEDEFLVKYETAALKAVYGKGITVPEVFETVNISGRPGFVMEKITGISMLDVMQRNPGGIFRLSKELARLHIRMKDISAPEGIMDLKKRVLMFLGRNMLLSEELKNFILKILGELPDGASICHGDFHPGNIFIQNGNSVLIDWCRAAKADPLADAAHTFLLLKNVPRIPGMNVINYNILNFAGKIITSTYLKEYRKNNPFDYTLFSKWLLIQASERLYFGHPSEKENLKIFIEKCHADHTKQKPELRWDKFY